MTSTKNWLNDMSALERAASKDWKLDVEGYGRGPIITGLLEVCEGCVGDSEPYHEEDAAFIAASREFVPMALGCIQDFVEKTPCLCGEFDYVVNKDCPKCELLAKWNLE